MRSPHIRRFGSARALRWSVGFGLFLLLAFSTFGQTTGTVEGTITDQSNAPLPGVSVAVTVYSPGIKLRNR